MKRKFLVCAIVLVYVLGTFVGGVSADGVQPLDAALAQTHPGRSISASVYTGGKAALYAGDTASFSAQLNGYEGLAVSGAWQRSSGGGWSDVAAQLSFSITLDASNASAQWRFVARVSGYADASIQTTGTVEDASGTVVAAPGGLTAPVVEVTPAPVTPAPVTPAPKTPEPEAEKPVVTEAPVVTEKPAPAEEPVVEVLAAQAPVVEEPAAEEPAAEEPAAEEPVVEEPAVEEPAVEEPAAEEPVVEEPAAEEPAAEEPAAEELVAEEPAAEEPVVEESAVEELAAGEPAVEKPAAEEPAAEEPAAEEPAAEEPAAEEPAAEEPAAEEPVVEEPAAEEPAAEEPATEEPVVEEPVTEEPAAEEPAVEELVAEEPAAEEPAAEEPVAEEPVVEEPTTEEPAAEEPAMDEPVVEEEIIVEDALVTGEEPAAGDIIVEEPAITPIVLYTAPSLDAAVLMTLDSSSQLIEIGREGDWAIVDFNGTPGYILSVVPQETEVPQEVPALEEAAEEEPTTEEPAAEEPLASDNEEMLLVQDLGMLMAEYIDENYPGRVISIYANLGGKVAPANGDPIVFTAVLKGYEGLSYDLRWQMSLDDAEWQDIEGAVSSVYTLNLNEQNTNWFLRVAVDITGLSE